jgi:hypothetical protein
MRLGYRAVEGDRRFSFRIEEKGFSGVTGFRTEFDAKKDAGGLYKTHGRGWVSQSSAEAVKMSFKDIEVWEWSVGFEMYETE